LVKHITFIQQSYSEENTVLTLAINIYPSRVIPGFHREAHEICALLGYHVAYSGNSLPTLSVPSSR